VLDSAGPQARSFPAAGYDAAGRRLVVAAGGNGASAYKDAMSLRLPAGGAAPSWRGVAPETGLTARDQASALLDPATGRVHVFGGFGTGTFPGAVDAGTHLADSWILTDPARPDDPTRWARSTPLDPGTVPLSREGAAVAHDSAGGRAFVVGGLNGDVTLGDVWVATVGRGRPTWQQLCSPTSCGAGPAARWAASAVYDPVAGRVIVFGGRSTSGATLDDTWALTLSPTPHWEQLASGGPRPPARWSAASAYDPARRRMVVWGGQTGADSAATPRNDTWSLALDATPAWSELHPAGPAPEARRSPAAAARPLTDASGGRRGIDLLVTTGYTATTGAHHNDVWRLRLDSPDGTWTELSPDDCAAPPPVPACRRSASAVWDAAADRLVLLFGRNPSGFLVSPPPVSPTPPTRDT
jgi:hypothetical protein